MFPHSLVSVIPVTYKKAIFHLFINFSFFPIIKRTFLPVPLMACEAKWSQYFMAFFFLHLNLCYISLAIFQE